MDREQLERLAKDPRFIPGIYNYCDRWCERCAFTSRCMTYAIDEEEPDDPESKDINNKAFWDKLHSIFELTMEMVRESAARMGIDLDAIDTEEYAQQNKIVCKKAEEQPYSLAAMKYIKMVNEWFDSNKELLEDKAEELQSLALADVPGAAPADDAVNINDCLEVIRWYQHQIYVKLCRAATSMFRGEFENLEYSAEDANGSAKVAIIGIERSIVTWGKLLNHFFEDERAILDILVLLKRLLKQAESSFPHARSFLRPDFDTQD
jgi:hypothetical protein